MRSQGKPKSLLCSSDVKLNTSVHRYTVTVCAACTRLEYFWRKEDILILKGLKCALIVPSVRICNFHFSGVCLCVHTWMCNLTYRYRTGLVLDAGRGTSGDAAALLTWPSDLQAGEEPTVGRSEGFSDKFSECSPGRWAVANHQPPPRTAACTSVQVMLDRATPSTHRQWPQRYCRVTESECRLGMYHCPS
jgi:hypothetical protein